MNLNMSKQSLVACGICLWALMGIVWAQDTIDGIAAIVNKEVITYSQVKDLVEPQEKALRDSIPQGGEELVQRIKALRLDALKALIETQLILQDFKKQGFELPDHVVDQRLQETIQTVFDGNRAAFIKTLEAQNKTLESYRKELKDQIIVQSMRHRNVSSEIMISPYKIEKYYQQNIEDFQQQDQVKLKMIFFKRSLFKEKTTDDSGAEVEYDPQKRIAEEIYRKLMSGSDFSSLASIYSEEDHKSKGGDWGWISRDTLRKELTDVVFRLRPGQHSHVITTEEGYYILQVYDYKRGKVQPLADVRDKIEAKLIQEERLKLQQKWIDSLKQKAYIKMF